jgi:hypothetical protein
MTSQINPTNINGSYPVAGQDNNSQGFRDNFTNIKVNFQDAADEITDLQNKVLLKAALDGTTLDNNLSDALLIAAQIQDFAAAKVAIGTTSGAITVNYSTGHYQTISTSGNISLSFNNFPGTGIYGYIKLQLNITNVAHTVTINAGSSILGTAGIQGYSAGSASVGTITFGATGYYEFAFGTYDQGATITVFDLNRGLTNFNAADLILDDVTASGNILAAGNVTGGNLRTAGTVSATGNVSGGNIVTLAQVSAGGNISGGNIVTVGAVTAGGNVTGGNIVGYVRPSTGSASLAPVVFTAGTNTSTPAAGALEYDGTVFYGSPAASQRGLLPSEHFVILSSNYTANDSSAAQKVFNVPSAGAITVTSNTTYAFEAVYYIAPAITFNAVSLATLFALGGTLTSIRYKVDSTVGLLGAVIASKSTQVGSVISTTVTDAAPGGAATNYVLSLRGIMRTNSAGTIVPQIQFSGSPGSAPIVLANSYFRLIPMGTGSVTTVGNWS